MKSCIRAEMYKAFHNKAFFVSLAIGLTMAAADILQNFIDMQSFPGAVSYTHLDVYKRQVFAEVKRMTPRQPLKGEPAALQSPVFFDGCNGIL